MAIFQTPVNSPIMRDLEQEVHDAITEDDEIVDYEVTPNYQGGGVIPVSIRIRALGSKKLNIDRTILNRR